MALSLQFLELKTCVVASTYCNSWIFEDLDASDPFRLNTQAEFDQVDYRIKKGIGSASPVVGATSDFVLSLTDSSLMAE